VKVEEERQTERRKKKKKRKKKQSTKMKKEICMSGMEQVIRNGRGHWRKRRDSLHSDSVRERRMKGSI